MEIKWGFAKGIYSILYYKWTNGIFYSVPILSNYNINNKINYLQ